LKPKLLQAGGSFFFKYLRTDDFLPKYFSDAL
jgi:hypothetical protein